MMTFDFVRQGAYREQLGNGQRTIAQSGCLLSCLTMAANAFAVGAFDLPEANRICRRAKAFVGSSLVVPSAAKALGLEVDERKAPTWSELVKGLRLGAGFVLGIDYKTGRSSGFSDADHFVFAFGLEPGDVVSVADPATGKAFRLTGLQLTYAKRPAVIAEAFAVRPLARSTLG